MIVHFHILENASGMQALIYACTLLEQAYQRNESVYVHTNSREDAEKLDNLLWTFRDDSFVPHQLHDPNADLPPPIQIGHGAIPQGKYKLLINLSREFPTSYSQFNEVAEIVFADPLVQQLARDRFRQYRDQGHELITHKIKAN